MKFFSYICNCVALDTGMCVEKKVARKFGGFQNSSYICTQFVMPFISLKREKCLGHTDRNSNRAVTRVAKWG